ARASHYQRLPGVVASASSSSYLGSTTSDLREIIRDVVREELFKLLPAAERPASLSVAEIVRDEVQRALQPETPVDVPAPEEPRLTYAAMARRPPQASRQATVLPRREPPAPQYFQRREERQYVRPEKPAPRKTDVWRTTDRRPLCFHCGEADHVYRRCPYRQLGLRGFHPDDPRPRYGERPRDINEYLRRSPPPGPSPRRGFRSPSPQRPASPHHAHAMTHVKMALNFPELKTTVGSHVDLPCVAQGYPPPHYTWYKEDRGRRLSVVESDRMQSSNGVLSIRAVNVHDGGRYVCIARNTVGEQKIETLLSVAVLLSAEVSPAFQTVAMGLPAVFNCSVEGQPVHSITWRKMVSQSQLRIQTVRRDDAGMYQCVAQNDRDSCQAAAQLRLDDISPTLVETFAPQVVKRGDPVSLLCRARGSPAPELTWAIDGDFLYPSHRLKITADRGSLEVRSLLNISEARHEDSGEYSCMARNDIATEAHSARLEVYGPPFVRPLRNVTVVSGTELALRCPYGGFPVDSLTWQKGGMVLPVNFRQTVDSRGRLLVRQAQKSADEGEYSCIVTGTSGLTASGSTYVSVVVAPVIDDHFFPDVIKVEEGTRSRLMCSVSKGDPPLRFRWLKNGLTIGSHGDRSIEATDDSSIIKFARVRFVDRGSYVCFVSNDAASVNRTVQLVVHVSPRWKTEPQNASAVLGASVFLHCASDGFPSPAITWKKGEGSAPRNFSYIHYNFRKHHFINGSLLVREVEESDQGFYLCEAQNGIGPGISKLVFLKVHVPPRFEVKHRSFLLKKGEDFRPQCLAVGDSPLLYSWEKNQNPLDAER
ncbi:hypothetical protein HPB47_002400, partial [Ixodes persulcatus]